MKNTFTIILLFSTTLIWSQVPDWLKNAKLTSNEEEITIKSKGNRLIKKYKDYPENTNEKQITYRIKYYEYLKNLEKINLNLFALSRDKKPEPFPLFISKTANITAKPIVNGGSSNSIVNFKFENDTIVHVTDATFPTKNFTLGTFTPINSKQRLSGVSLVIKDKNNIQYELQNLYTDLEKNYPYFHNWLNMYSRYGDKVYETQEQIAEENRLKQSVKIGHLACETYTDEFTNEEIIETSQRSLVTIRSEVTYKRTPEREEQGVFIDSEKFVCALSGIKRGKITKLQLYLSIGHETINSHYGILTKDSSIDFKLQNGNIVKLFFSRTSTPELKSNNIHTYFKNTLVLAESDIKNFNNSEVEKIRIHYSKGYVVTMKQQKKI